VPEDKEDYKGGRRGGLETAFIRVDRIGRVSGSYYSVLASLSGTGGASLNTIDTGLSSHSTDGDGFIQGPLIGLTALGDVGPGNGWLTGYSIGLP